MSEDSKSVFVSIVRLCKIKLHAVCEVGAMFSLIARPQEPAARQSGVWQLWPVRGGLRKSKRKRHLSEWSLRWPQRSGWCLKRAQAGLALLPWLGSELFCMIENVRQLKRLLSAMALGVFWLRSVCASVSQVCHTTCFSSRAGCMVALSSRPGTRILWGVVMSPAPRESMRGLHKYCTLVFITHVGCTCVHAHLLVTRRHFSWSCYKALTWSPSRICTK
jgi:hypothetical protein